MTIINLGVIGLGRMGLIYSNHILRHLGNARLAAVASTSPGAREKLPVNAAEVAVHTDFRNLLADPTLDGVIVATLTHTHYDIVLAAAEAGKAIFCEKPIALTLAETDAMLAAAEKAGVLFQVGFMRRFDRGFQAAKRRVEAGEIGTPIMVHSVSRDPNCPAADWADPAVSGGLILDLAIHDIDVLRWFTNDEVEQVYAAGALLNCPQLAGVGDIDNAVVTLHFGRGCLGLVEACRNARYGYDIRCEIRGTEGTLQVGYLRDTPVTALTQTGSCHDIVPWFEERFTPAYGAQIDHFIDCIRRDQPPAVGPVDARAALQVSLAATRSQQQQRPVKVAEIRA
jgi:inositol 2-dehydrogenase